MLDTSDKEDKKMQIYLNKLEEEAHIGREIFFSFFY